MYVNVWITLLVFAVLAVLARARRCRLRLCVYDLVRRCALWRIVCHDMLKYDGSKRIDSFTLSLFLYWHSETLEDSDDFLKLCHRRCNVELGNIRVL